MADYGRDDSVEHEQYCMNSMQKRNVNEMNKKMGYDSMSDLANTKKYPASMQAQRSNKQLDPVIPRDSNYDYNRKR